MIHIKIYSMANILGCPMQCRVHDTVVSKCPKFVSASPAENNQILLVHDHDSCSPPLIILLSLDSVTSYFEARCPSLEENEDEKILKCHLTSKSLLLHTSTSLYSLQEDSMVAYMGCLIAKLSIDPHSPDMSMSSVVSVSCTAVDIEIFLQS